MKEIVVTEIYYGIPINRDDLLAFIQDNDKVYQKIVDTCMNKFSISAKFSNDCVYDIIKKYSAAYGKQMFACFYKDKVKMEYTDTIDGYNWTWKNGKVNEISNKTISLGNELSILKKWIKVVNSGENDELIDIYDEMTMKYKICYDRKKLIDIGISLIENGKKIKISNSDNENHNVYIMKINNNNHNKYKGQLIIGKSMTIEGMKMGEIWNENAKYREMFIKHFNEEPSFHISTY